MAGGRVTEVKDASQWESILKESGGGFGSGKAVVVDFTATWCGPCKMIGPIFEKLSTQYPNVKFVKVDVDEVQEVAQACGVSAMPTFQAYFGGELVDTVVGADPRQLQALIEKVDGRAGDMGTGQKLGGASAAPDSTDDRRARMLAAAEARMNAGGSS